MKAFVAVVVVLAMVAMEITALPMAGAVSEVIEVSSGSKKCCNERCACWSCPDTTTCNLTECTCNYGSRQESPPQAEQAQTKKVEVKYCSSPKCHLYTCPDGWLCNYRSCNCVPPAIAPSDSAETNTLSRDDVFGVIENLVKDKLDHMGTNDVVEVVQEKMTLIRKADKIEAVDEAESEDLIQEQAGLVTCHEKGCPKWLCPDGWKCGNCVCVPPAGSGLPPATYEQVMTVTSYICCGGRCGCFNCSGTTYQCNLVNCTCHIP